MLASDARSLARRLSGLVLGLAVVACDGPVDAPAPAPTQAPTADAAPVPAPAPVPVEADPAPGNPLQALAPADPQDAVFGGVVAESIAAGGYTYLRVATDDGDRWVATMGKGAPVGHRVHVKNMGTRHDFHSRRLGRRFDVLAFGIVREA